MDKFENIDAYIASFPLEVQAKLEEIRTAIKETAPEAVEVISYQMPTFKQIENLVYFAAFKNHIGFYPTSSGIAAFQAELSVYKSSKGAVQFPLDQPMPLELIKKMVLFRLNESKERAALKKEKKKK